MAKGTIRYSYPQKPHVTKIPKLTKPRSVFKTGFSGPKVGGHPGAAHLSLNPLLGHAIHQRPVNPIPGVVRPVRMGQHKQGRRKA